jgi:hypothetical protein
MATTYEDLFGNKSPLAGSKQSRWMKWDNDGETLLVQVTGELEMRDQQIDGKTKWLVRMVKGGKVKPMPEGDFDPEKVEGAWKPNERDAFIPVRVMGKKFKNGEKDESFQPFDSEWELGKGNFLDALQAEMKETEKAIDTGLMVALKRLDSTSKPHKFSVKFL